MRLDMIGQERGLAKLVDAALVAAGRIAGIGEFGFEKSRDTGLGHLHTYETRAQKTRRPPTPDRYVAIPLGDPHRRPLAEETWPSDDRPRQRLNRQLHADQRALAATLAALLGLLGFRIALFYIVVKDVECSTPSLTVLPSLPTPIAIVSG